MKTVKNFSLCVLSAFLLTIAYPQIEIWPLAWIALLPLFWLIKDRTPGKAFAWGILFGFLFFFATLGWLIYVTWPGAILMSLYLAVYPALFCFGFIHFQKLPLWPRSFVLASLWSFLEFIRAHLFTGFGWVSLGHSQYKNLPMIQLVDITGLYGVSFLVILVNLIIFESLRILKRRQTELYRSLRLLQITVVGLLLVSLAYGAVVLKTYRFSSSVKIAVVQPNIPQKIKWQDEYMPFIVGKTLRLTDQVQKDKPDIILWPETSLPGVWSQQPAFVQQIQLKALDLSIPMVVGAIVQDQQTYYNSAIYIGPDGKINGQYHKIHLVPFGEFLPLRPVLGWLNEYIGLEDFSSGQEYTLFNLKTENPHRFGVLICFEDALGYLWRNFTMAGAEFMMNMTNDAWFMDTKEPFIHLQSAVLEAVANKRSLVRAANTGVSGFISPLGEIIHLAQDPKGKKTFVESATSSPIPLNSRITFYTKYPRIFTYLCFVCILWGVWLLRRHRRTNA